MRLEPWADRVGAPGGSLGRPGRRSGVAAVELAVLAPCLALLFVITLDFARAFYYKLTLDNCARNGALFGSNLRSYQEKAWVNSYNDITDATIADGKYLNPPLSSSHITTATGTGSDGNANVTVTINYPFTPITQLPGLGATLTLHAKASMRVAP
jgi:Flp pilus assembly protein TadG